MTNLEIIRSLIERLVYGCDCDFDNEDFEQLRWLFKHYECAENCRDNSAE